MPKLRIDLPPSNWEPVVPGQERGERVFLSVADQKAAGVPDDETVTVAEQRAGTPLPDFPGQEQVVEEGDEPSAGTSSSTSGSKQGKSGASAQGTGSSRQSPAQTAASPSSKDPQAGQAQSSTAGSTSGSTQGTGRSQQSRRSSSGD